MDASSKRLTDMSSFLGLDDHFLFLGIARIRISVEGNEEVPIKMEAHNVRARLRFAISIR